MAHLVQVRQRKDEVIIKRDGYPTYFGRTSSITGISSRSGASTVWWMSGARPPGPDRSRAEALAVLGIDPERLAVLLVQLVSGQAGRGNGADVRRAGVGISLKEMLDEVGPTPCATSSYAFGRCADGVRCRPGARQSSEKPRLIEYAHAVKC